MTFFPHLKNNVSRDPQDQNEVKTKVIVPKQAYSGIFLTEMESLDNILQNNSK